MFLVNLSKATDCFSVGVQISSVLQPFDTSMAVFLFIWPSYSKKNFSHGQMGLRILQQHVTVKSLNTCSGVLLCTAIPTSSKYLISEHNLSPFDAKLRIIWLIFSLWVTCWGWVTSNSVTVAQADLSTFTTPSLSLMAAACSGEYTCRSHPSGLALVSSSFSCFIKWHIMQRCEVFLGNIVWAFTLLQKESKHIPIMS